MSKHLTNAKSRSVTASSAKFTDPLEAGVTYEVSSDVDCWVKLSSESETLTAGEDGAVALYGGVPRTLTPKVGAYLFVIRAVVDGTVNLVEVEAG